MLFRSDQACDFVFTGDQEIDFDLPGTLGVICSSYSWIKKSESERTYPFFTWNEFLSAGKRSEEINFVSIGIEELSPGFEKKIPAGFPIVFIFDTVNEHGMAEQRKMFIEFAQRNIPFPVIIRRNYADLSDDTLMLHAATDCGGLLVDGFGDGIWKIGRAHV